MSRKGKVTEPDKGRVHSGGALGILCTVLFLALAIGCVTHFPLDENEHLAVMGVRVVYRESAAAMHSRSFSRVASFYESLGTFRFRHMRQAVVESVQPCRPSTRGSVREVVWGGTSGAGGIKRKAPSVFVCRTTSHVAAAASMKPLAFRPLKRRVVPVAVTMPQLADASHDSVSFPAPNVTVVQPSGPVNLVSLRDRATCNQGVSMNVVAHEDDDLLFMNPDIQADITAGRCIRTVYLTAGDAGQPASYWIGREDGVKAAYAAMYKVDDTWRDEQQLLNGKLVTVSYLQDIPQVALVFMQLPDGNLWGEGFAATGYESLHKLLGGQISAINTVTGTESYSKDDIIRALNAIMQADLPEIIRTQNPHGLPHGDHADHTAGAILAGMAAREYTAQHRVIAYAGYPDKLLDPNLNDKQVTEKQAVFLTYALHDNAVCQTVGACAKTNTYGNYLTREYRIADAASGR